MVKADAILAAVVADGLARFHRILEEIERAEGWAVDVVLDPGRLMPDAGLRPPDCVPRVVLEGRKGRTVAIDLTGSGGTMRGDIGNFVRRDKAASMAEGA